jgi:ferredoxin-NADP reductase
MHVHQQIRKASLGTTSLLVGAAVTGIGLSYLWRRSLEGEYDDKQTLFPAPVDVNAYRTVKLISSKNVGAGAKVLKFRYEHGPGIYPLRPFSHVNVRGVTMDVPPEYPFGLKVERPYTPISSARHEFDLLVKSYPKDDKATEKNPRKGITSRFLLSLEPGQTVEVKGPIPTVEDDLMREALASRKFVGMICGGSGVTPMIQLLSRLGSSDHSRRFSLLWSNRSSEDMFFKKELESMTRGMKNVNVRYTLTRLTPPGWLHDTGRVSKELLRARMPPPSPECIIVVCGPDSFVEAVAGGKKGPDGKWRGPIGGFLKELDYTTEHVLRL